MASPALIPALPPTLSEPGGELPVDSADEFSESDDCDDFHDNDDWDGGKDTVGDSITVATN
ncbi:hypothetical protein HIM_04915 [Hirsutella minnesotensis 3608]|uniref:Uncharacterized protein n=1 Tax=Hirsutella minnesotensis 3608 TaxID=1043627 RepID=A0A0F7ZV02_9HYPO|nr:hypothetical protein HIM_04915 [Hirsutella minnesotensis 3608]